jgi:hypothetical protein
MNGFERKHWQAVVMVAASASSVIPSANSTVLSDRSPEESTMIEPDSSEAPNELNELIRALSERDTLLFDPVTGDGLQACGKCGTCGVSASKGRPGDLESNINIIRDRIIRNPEIVHEINERFNIRVPQTPKLPNTGGGQ